MTTYTSIQHSLSIHTCSVLINSHLDFQKNALLRILCILFPSSTVKKFLPSFGVAVCIAFFLVQTVDAHSGCCSHHGGVSGCGCGDGTSLSATCAPYYPECSGGSQTYTPAPAPKVIVKKCPADSTLTSGTCTCNTGYSSFGNSCIKIPKNAHAVSDGKNAWLCDAGYSEKGTACVVKPAPVVKKSFSSSSKKMSSSSSRQSSKAVRS
jgi:hypothetical protein